MEAFLQALIGVLTPYINRRVDTGDRNYDIAVAGFITMCLSSVLFWSYKKWQDIHFKNWVLFKFYSWWDKLDGYDLKAHRYYNDTVSNLGKVYSSFQVSADIHTKLDYYAHTQPNGIDDTTTLLGYFHSGLLYYAYDKLFYFKTNNNAKTIIAINTWIKSAFNKESKSTHRSIKGLNKQNKLQTLGNIGSHKTFDTIFYDQKEEVVEAVTKFKEGRLYPKGISMDNKLGILLYGPPGTGKTGTISACANLLGRDVMVLDFSVIKTCEELDNVLKPEEFDKYIYVFDEFDCILDVLVSDEKKAVAEADKEDTTDWSKLLMVAEGEERKQILEMLKEGRTKQKDKSQSLNLGYLLRKLDGLEDATGRFIIATTNNPDHIHPALLRPGRFDIKLCLGNCSAKMYVDILGAFFELDEAGRAKVVTAGLPVGRWSPLQTINMALTKKTLGATLEALMNLSKDSK